MVITERVDRWWHPFECSPQLGHFHQGLSGVMRGFHISKPGLGSVKLLSGNYSRSSASPGSLVAKTHIPGRHHLCRAQPEPCPDLAVDTDFVGKGFRSARESLVGGGR